MRRLCAVLFVAALCPVVFEFSVEGMQQRPRRRANLPKVQKVHVGDMGAAEEAERFRLMLEEQLLKRDFDVVLDPAAADAVLTGVLSIRTYEYNSDARVTVRLESRDGDVIWAKDFGPKRFSVIPFDLKEQTQRRAEEVAEALRREFKSARKKQP